MSVRKVLIPVDHAVGISGPHRNVVGSLNALGARDDVEVVLLTSIIDKCEPYASAPNIEVRLGFQPHDPKRIPMNLWRIQRAALGCDVIYVPSGLKAFLYAQTVRLGRRLVAGPNVTPLPLGSRHDSPGAIELKFLSDRWIEMSRHRQEHVQRQSGIGDIEYVHHALDLVKFSPSHRRPDIWESQDVPADTTKIIFVGRDNEPRKGVKQLIDAAEILGREPGLRTHFVLVGRISEETRRRAQSLDNVSILGPRIGQELTRLYASADIAVIPSSWESFGFTVLESMASGLPVVTTRAGAIPEIVEDGVSGLLLDIVESRSRHIPEAGDKIADAIRVLMADQCLRRDMGGAARQRAEERFSEARLGRDLVALFRGEPVQHPAADTSRDQ